MRKDYTNYDPKAALVAKVVLIGDSNAGKSSILTRFADNLFEEAFVPTIGVDFKSKNFLHKTGRTVKMQVWDTAGQERFRSITGSYYRGSHAAIIVYDITNHESWDNIPTWLNHIENRIGLEYKDPSKEKNYNANKGHSSIPIFVVGNKLDLNNKRVVIEKNARNFVNKSNIKNLHYFECSAKTDTNIHSLFQDLSDQIMLNEDKIYGYKLEKNNKQFNFQNRGQIGHHHRRSKKDRSGSPNPPNSGVRGKLGSSACTSCGGSNSDIKKSSSLNDLTSNHSSSTASSNPIKLSQAAAEMDNTGGCCYHG